jgi:glycosyltransferase involved in cell wall biosynthesis
VYTLHDPGRYLHPELMVRRIRDVDNDRLREQLTDPLLRGLITVSQSSRDDIEQALGPLPLPLAVVPNFVSAPFAQMLTEARAAQHPLYNGPFLFTLGVYMPLKNIPTLIAAFRHARVLAPDIVPARLLLAGRQGWERHLPFNNTDDVRILGHLSEEALARRLATCTAFCWPTLYEGFGLAAVEALIAGAPVVCSDIPVNREVLGDLAIYTDPHDVEQMAKAIIVRCTLPGPDTQTVDAHLARYTAAAAGAALRDVYRASV